MATINVDYTLFELTLLKTAVENRIAGLLACAAGVCGSDHNEQQVEIFSFEAVELRRMQADLEDALALATEEEHECSHNVAGSAAPVTAAKPDSFASEAVRADLVDLGRAPLALVEPQKH